MPAAPTEVLDRGPRSSFSGVTTSAVRGLRVAELASAVGVSPDTVRYYERAALLPPPGRTTAGYRSCDAGAVDRLGFIQGAQRLGLRPADIRDLLAVRDTGTCPCEPAEDLLRRRMAEVDAEIARLVALRAEMETPSDASSAADCPPPSPGTWCPPVGGDPSCPVSSGAGAGVARGGDTEAPTLPSSVTRCGRGGRRTRGSRRCRADREADPCFRCCGTPGPGLPSSAARSPEGRPGPSGRAGPARRG